MAETDPGRYERVTGTVASWKTDQLGFEVEGRVQFVIEEETNVAGQVYDKDGKLVKRFIDADDTAGFSYEKDIIPFVTKLAG